LKAREEQKAEINKIEDEEVINDEEPDKTEEDQKEDEFPAASVLNKRIQRLVQVNLTLLSKLEQQIITGNNSNRNIG